MNLHVREDLLFIGEISWATCDFKLFPYSFNSFLDKTLYSKYCTSHIFTLGKKNENCLICSLQGFKTFL